MINLLNISGIRMLLLAIALLICISVFMYDKIAVSAIFSYSKATYHELIAEGAYNKGRWGNAEINYRAALPITLYPQNVEWNLGNSLYMQGRYSEAVIIYKKLLRFETAEFYPNILYNLGNSYYMLGQFEESLDAYKTALLLRSDDRQIRENFLVLSSIVKDVGHNKRSAGQTKMKSENEGEKKEDQSGLRGDKDKNFNQEGSYQITDEEMNNLLKISKEKVRVPSGTKSKNNRNDYDGPDY